MLRTLTAALALLATSAIAEPTTLTDAQMNSITAGRFDRVIFDRATIREGGLVARAETLAGVFGADLRDQFRAAISIQLEAIEGSSPEKPGASRSRSTASAFWATAGAR